MLKFLLKKKSGLKILCLGAHADDIEIGCGGSLLKLFDEYRIQQIYWIVFSANEIRYNEALVSAGRFTKDIQNKVIEVKSFKDGFFPFTGSAIKEYFEELKQKINPDIIFTHYLYDKHQDHRLIGDLTWNTFRNHLILEYEIPKYDGDLNTPNLYVPLSRELVEKKNTIIIDSFKSQREKYWFEDSILKAILKIRGVESKSTYAEAFYARKIII